ncbi:MAG: cation:proton antiporter [Thermoanaerobaculia bacterium]
MHGDLSLVTTIAVALGAALLLGFLALRLKLPAIVGYLLAGVLIGPATPGFVADVGLAQQLSEIGVMLLMFGVGLHFSLEDLKEVRGIAVPGAVAKIVLATLMGMGAAHWWGWTPGAGLVFGLALSVASTVVLLRALEDRGLVDSLNGRIAIGWLLVEDLVMVLVLVLLPALGGFLGSAGAPGAEAPAAPLFGANSLGLALVVAIVQLGIFVVAMLVGGRRLFPWLLWQVARTGSRELFTLCVMAAAVGIAYASSAVFGVSFALGSFFAGMMLSESALAHRAAEESLPFRDAFSVLFFVAVGMLIDPAILMREPLRVAVVVAIIIVGKFVIALGLVLLFRYPLNTALTIAATGAQIGEFSFILAGMGVGLGLLPIEGRDLILAGALVSIGVNHLVLAGIEPAQRWVRKRSALANALERPSDPLAALPMEVGEKELTGHVVVVGYGRVGRRIGDALTANGTHFVVADRNREVVEGLRARGVHAVSGDASDPVVMAQTHVMRASLLVIATPDSFSARKMLGLARILNPGIETVVRTHSEEEAELLREERAGKVFMGEHELALGMTRHVLEFLAATTSTAR